MPNLIGLRAAASRFSIESWLFALPMTAPANHYSIAFGHFLTIHASEPFERSAQLPGVWLFSDLGDCDFSSGVRALLTLAEVALPPKGGLLAMDKPMTLFS